MLVSILILLVLPFINTSEVRSTTFRPIFKIFYWMLFADFIILGWVGQQGVEDYIILIGQVATIFYFVFFAILVPLTGIVEKKLVYNTDFGTDVNFYDFMQRNLFFFSRPQYTMCW